MMATEVTGLVIDAMLKIVSFAIGVLLERAALAEGLVVEDAVLVDDRDDDSRYVTAIGRALEECRKGRRSLLRQRRRCGGDDGDEEKRKKPESVVSWDLILHRLGPLHRDWRIWSSELRRVAPAPDPLIA